MVSLINLYIKNIFPVTNKNFIPILYCENRFWTFFIKGIKKTSKIILIMIITITHMNLVF
jgi:hypothetical protein